MEAVHKWCCLSTVMFAWAPIYEQYASHLLHSHKPGSGGLKQLLWAGHGTGTAFCGRVAQL